jgi:hypothetical protein
MADAVYSLLSELGDVAVPAVPADGSVLRYSNATRQWAPAQGGGEDLSYVHHQLTPATAWTINHNLAKFPSVRTVDSAGNEIQGIVLDVSNNTLKVSFFARGKPVAIGGSAYLN